MIVSKARTQFLEKNPGGRPPKYDDPEELQAMITDYFKHGVRQKKIFTPSGKAISVPVPTITGLVIHCGFCDRTSFYAYEKKPKFAHTIKQARSFIEREYEELAQTKGGPAAIFALKNFGWEDKNKVEHTISDLGNSINAARERVRAAEKKD
jgi:hypothetical protein